MSRDHGRVWYLLVSEPSDSVVVDGRLLTRGCRVRLTPARRGDLFDSPLAGKLGRVDGIDHDHEGTVKIAVVIDDDPGRDSGANRYLAHRFFFSPTEVEPIDDVRALSRRLLIAGIGNFFLGDDGFGVEVVRRLTERVLPAGVEVADFGIRGMDLTYALGNGWHGAILVDAMRRGEPAGTLTVLEPEVPDRAEEAAAAGHGMDPMSVLAFARRHGAVPERTLVVGCEPAYIPDVGAGEDTLTELSPEVEAAVERAVEHILQLAAAFVEHGRFTAESTARDGAGGWARTADGSYERSGEEP